MKKLCLYGGSFDPVHFGHITFAKKIIQRFKPESLLFIPTYFSPFKGNKRYTSNKHRLNMLNIACEDIPKAEVCQLEIERKGFSYTIETLKHIKENYPDHKLFWIIGDDHIQTLHHWNNYPEHFQYCDFIILPRSGAVNIDMISNHAFKDQLHFMDLEKIEISSTQIRENLANDKSIESFVPEAINKYIKTNKLYR